MSDRRVGPLSAYKGDQEASPECGEQRLGDSSSDESRTGEKQDARHPSVLG